MEDAISLKRKFVDMTQDSDDDDDDDSDDESIEDLTGGDDSDDESQGDDGFDSDDESVVDLTGLDSDDDEVVDLPQDDDVFIVTQNDDDDDGVAVVTLDDDEDDVAMVTPVRGGKKKTALPVEKCADAQAVAVLCTNLRAANGEVLVELESLKRASLHCKALVGWIVQRPERWVAAFVNGHNDMARVGAKVNSSAELRAVLDAPLWEVVSKGEWRTEMATDAVKALAQPELARIVTKATRTTNNSTRPVDDLRPEVEELVARSDPVAVETLWIEVEKKAKNRGGVAAFVKLRSDVNLAVRLAGAARGWSGQRPLLDPRFSLSEEANAEKRKYQYFGRDKTKAPRQYDPSVQTDLLPEHCFSTKEAFMAYVLSMDLLAGVEALWTIFVSQDVFYPPKGDEGLEAKQKDLLALCDVVAIADPHTAMTRLADLLQMKDDLPKTRGPTAGDWREAPLSITGIDAKEIAWKTKRAAANEACVLGAGAIVLLKALMETRAKWPWLTRFTAKDRLAMTCILVVDLLESSELYGHNYHLAITYLEVVNDATSADEAHHLGGNLEHTAAPLKELEGRDARKKVAMRIEKVKQRGSWRQRLFTDLRHLKRHADAIDLATGWLSVPGSLGEHALNVEADVEIEKEKQEEKKRKMREKEEMTTATKEKKEKEKKEKKKEKEKTTKKTKKDDIWNAKLDKAKVRRDRIQCRFCDQKHIRGCGQATVWQKRNGGVGLVEDVAGEHYCRYPEKFSVALHDEGRGLLLPLIELVGWDVIRCNPLGGATWGTKAQILPRDFGWKAFYERRRTKMDALKSEIRQCRQHTMMAEFVAKQYLAHVGQLSAFIRGWDRCLVNLQLVACALGAEKLANIVEAALRDCNFTGMPDLTLIRFSRPTRPTVKSTPRIRINIGKTMPHQNSRDQILKRQETKVPRNVTLRENTDDDPYGKEVLVDGVRVGWVPKTHNRLVQFRNARVVEINSDVDWVIEAEPNVLQLDVHDSDTFDIAFVEVKSHKDSFSGRSAQVASLAMLKNAGIDTRICYVEPDTAINHQVHSSGKGHRRESGSTKAHCWGGKGHRLGGGSTKAPQDPVVIEID